MSVVKEYSSVDEWPEVMDCKTMAKLLGISPSSARRLMYRSDFPVLMLGPKLHRIRKGDLLKWLEKQAM